LSEEGITPEDTKELASRRRWSAVARGGSATTRRTSSCSSGCRRRWRRCRTSLAPVPRSYTYRL